MAIDQGPIARNAAWVLVLLAHLFVFPYYERLNNPNENVRVWTSKALADHGHFAIETVERAWGPVDDKVSSGGHLYSAKAPGTSLLGAPVVLVHDAAAKALTGRPPSKRATTLLLRLFAVALPLGAFFWAFSRYVGRLTRLPAARDLLVVGLGLGSVMYPYGVIFVGHAHGAALAFLAFMLLSPPEEGDASTRAIAGAGVAAGAAVLFEYQLGVVALVLAVYAFARYRRRALALIAGALPPALFLAVYHTALFGKPWALPWEHVTNPGFAAYHAQGFLGLTAPRPSAMVEMLFAPDLGLFVFSPFLLFGLVGAARAAARGLRAQGVTMLAACAAILLFISSMTFWRGGWCAGPRYISVAAPFLACGAAHLWDRPRGGSVHPALTIALGAAVGVSVFLSGLSAVMFPHYPPQLDNPVFDLALPLLRRGFVPYSLGWALGLRGLPSLLPVGALLLAAVALAVRGPATRQAARLRHGAAAILIAAVLLLSFARYGGRPNPGDARALAFVQGIWEPRP